MRGTPGQEEGTAGPRHRGAGRQSRAPSPLGARKSRGSFLKASPGRVLGSGMVKEPAKTRRKAWEGREEEEESGEGNPQAGSHRRVEAAFHCRTRENISVEQRGRQGLQLYYIVSAQPAALSCRRQLPAHGGTRPGAGADSLTRVFPIPSRRRRGCSTVARG